jgi:hypothetical protein
VYSLDDVAQVLDRLASAAERIAGVLDPPEREHNAAAWSAAEDAALLREAEKGAK